MRGRLRKITVDICVYCKKKNLRSIFSGKSCLFTYILMLHSCHSYVVSWCTYLLLCSHADVNTMKDLISLCITRVFVRRMAGTIFFMKETNTYNNRCEG